MRNSAQSCRLAMSWVWGHNSPTRSDTTEPKPYSKLPLHLSVGNPNLGSWALPYVKIKVQWILSLFVDFVWLIPLFFVNIVYIYILVILHIFVFLHTLQGCDSVEVQACVCTQDPFCCNVQWDDTCAEMVADVCDFTCTERALYKLFDLRSN